MHSKVKAWKKIKDEDVRHIWVCPECGKIAEISPEWYADNGTPMCITDPDKYEGHESNMHYSHTEIKTRA